MVLVAFTSSRWIDAWANLTWTQQNQLAVRMQCWTGWPVYHQDGIRVAWPVFYTKTAGQPTMTKMNSVWKPVRYIRIQVSKWVSEVYSHDDVVLVHAFPSSKSIFNSSNFDRQNTCCLYSRGYHKLFLFRGGGEMLITFSWCRVESGTETSSQDKCVTSVTLSVANCSPQTYNNKNLDFTKMYDSSKYLGYWSTQWPVSRTTSDELATLATHSWLSWQQRRMAVFSALANGAGIRVGRLIVHSRLVAYRSISH